MHMSTGTARCGVYTVKYTVDCTKPVLDYTGEAQLVRRTSV